MTTRAKWPTHPFCSTGIMPRCSQRRSRCLVFRPCTSTTTYKVSALPSWPRTYFTQLGTRAALGRMLNPAVDGTIGDPPVMVIGYGLAGPMWLARRAPRPTLLILTIACGNLGALLLARAVQREREIGIRRAVGASGARVFRQLCTESLLLATLGAVAGLALGCAVTRIALTVLDAPKWLSAVPDRRILLLLWG